MPSFPDCLVHLAERLLFTEFELGFGRGRAGENQLFTGYMICNTLSSLGNPKLVVQEVSTSNPYSAALSDRNKKKSEREK